jgi:hypothetical protein
MDIIWTTTCGSKSLLDETIWQDARNSGCLLHFGYESGNERVLKLMDKATTAESSQHLQMSANVGIWNHCMGFLAAKGRSLSSVQFTRENKEHVHSLGFGV